MISIEKESSTLTELVEIFGRELEEVGEHVSFQRVILPLRWRGMNLK